MPGSFYIPALGGGIAQAGAMATGSKAITFNPAWVSNVTQDRFNLSINAGHITNYIIQGEILNAVQSLFGWTVGLTHGGEDHFENVDSFI